MLPFLFATLPRRGGQKEVLKQRVRDRSAWYMTSDATMGTESQHDDSSSDKGIFKTQCVPPSPKWRPGKPIRKVCSAKCVESTDSSRDSPPEPIMRLLMLKAYVENLKEKKYERRKKKHKATGRP